MVVLILPTWIYAAKIVDADTTSLDFVTYSLDLLLDVMASCLMCKRKKKTAAYLAEWLDEVDAPSFRRDDKGSIPARPRGVLCVWSGTGVQVTLGATLVIRRL